MTKTPPSEASAWRARTQLVRGGLKRSENAETSEALYLTSGYVYASAEEAAARFAGEDESGFIYSRFSNPTVSMFEERLALLEGAEACRGTATGMAAVTAAILCQLSAGDHMVSSRALFGSCRYVVETLCPRFGIETTLVDGRDLNAWRGAVRPNTKAMFLESPANPTLELVDIAAVAEIARSAGARLLVDNVFATPILQKPLELGADIVIYSATKHIDGQGRVLGGAILCDQAFLDEHLQVFLRQTGPALSPFNAWTLLKSLETLELRVHAQTESAGQIAAALAERPNIPRLLYPGHPAHPQATLAAQQMSGGGNMIAFELTGGQDSAFRFLNALRVIDISNNLGDAKSLITHPRTTTHQRLTEEARLELGVTPGLVRLSVGLEDPADLIADLEGALDAI